MKANIWGGDSHLGRPDVDALVEAARGQELAVGGESDTVHRLSVLGEGVDASPSLHIPQPHRRVKRRTADRPQSRTQLSKNIYCDIDSIISYLFPINI
jgi:hypothetical protein